MNKRDFINKLANELKISIEDSKKINDIIESEMFIGKKNKEIIINKLVSIMNYSYEDANVIYNKIMNIISDEIKNKILHPFDSK